jgi:Protein of unknown function (DUF3710)
VPGRRRQKRTDRSKVDATPPWETRVRQETQPTAGPYDERDAPADELPRIDLGALRIPISDGYDVRLDLNEAQQVMSATLAGADGTMQLGVFAAPRNEGIWDEVRVEIAESLNSQRRGSTSEADGPFGPELRTTLPADGGKGTVPARFIGVDGPRWFVRALLAGPVAADPVKAKPFEDAFRGCVIVRGVEPLPVRDPVPLRLPADLELPAAE